MIDRYVKLLKQGEVIAFPTETVYGLGADAFNPDAIKKVYKIKGRPVDNPLIVHVSDMEMLHTLSKEVNADAQKLINAFWPGPLTFIFPKKNSVLDVITSGLDTVAIRMPDHKLALGLIKKTGPLVAPSANLSGKPSPTRAEHVRQDFGSDFPVLDGGPCQIGLESTVLDLSSEPYSILRPGHISTKNLEDELGKKLQPASRQKSHQPRSPGMKYSHYSPNATVRWMRKGEDPENRNTMYLYPVSGGRKFDRPNVIFYQNNFIEFARDLYDRFRQADIRGYTDIAIEHFENQDALLNRIEKAMGQVKHST